LFPRGAAEMKKSTFGRAQGRGGRGAGKPFDETGAAPAHPQQEEGPHDVVAGRLRAVGAGANPLGPIDDVGRAAYTSG